MISLALVLALSPLLGQEGLTVSFESAPSRDLASGHAANIVLVPYGEGLGSYTAPTAYKNGEMVALLEDATGKPLWVLQAEILPSGNINGDLSLLKYGGNPAQALPLLSVAGNAIFKEDGRSVFSATIFTKSFGQIPVIPVGEIQGALRKELAPELAMPVLVGRSGLVARALSAAEAAQASSVLPPVLTGDGRVIICTKGPDAQLAKLQSVGGMSQAGQSLAARPGQSDAGHSPKFVQASLSGVEAAEKRGLAGGFGEYIGGVITCPKGPGFSLSSVQSVSKASAESAGSLEQGSIVPEGEKGEVYLVWWLND